MLSPGAQRLAATQNQSRPPQGAPTCWMRPAQVQAVDLGAASDGNGLLTVTYGDSNQQCAYLDSYTPQVGHTVILLISSDGGLLCLGHPIGTP